MAPPDIDPATVRKGAALSTFSALCFGSAGVFVIYAYRAGVLPGTGVFLRFAISALVLIPALTVGKQWVTLPLRQTVVMFSLGMVCYTILSITFFEALRLLPAWLVYLFTALHPLTVNVGSWIFLRERILRWQLLALTLVVLGGISLFVQPFEGAHWLGLLLMSLNVLTMAVYVLVGQHWTRGVPPVVSSTWIIIGGTAGTLLYATVVNEFSFSFAPIGWLWAGCYGLLSTAMGFVTRWWSIGKIGASRAMIIGAIEPLWGVILAVVVLGEQLSTLQGLGGILILMGLFLARWQRA